MFDGKTILVTGGTGSFGRRFISEILERYDPRKVIVYSRDELKQYMMQEDRKFQSPALRFFIGDVRDKDRLFFALSGGVDYVVHAAALKQVPALEYNPFEAVKTNVMGTQNVVETSIAAGVHKVIGLSTDKAAAPINLYGATKLTADKLLVAANNSVADDKTRFSVVRYGNVMGSRGSVIPFFLRKKSEGCLPITDSRMTRFTITLSEGVEFVIGCLKNMQGGEIFVPKLPSYRLVDVATAVDPDIKTEIIGLRPGEKIHEELITSSEWVNTIELEDSFIICPSEEFRRSYVVEEKVIEGDIVDSNNAAPYKERYSYNSGNNSHFLSVAELRSLIQTSVEIPDDGQFVF